MPRLLAVRPSAPRLLETRHPLLVGSALVLALAGLAVAVTGFRGGWSDDGSRAARGAAAAPGASQRTERVRSRLRDLVVAQERHWSAHGTYTTDVSALGFFPTPNVAGVADSVVVEVIFAGGRGWTAVGTHRSAPAGSCVMYVGRREELPALPATSGAHLKPAQEGVPTCDRF